jgi:hypothetical protein
MGIIQRQQPHTKGPRLPRPQMPGEDHGLHPSPRARYNVAVPAEKMLE